MRRSLAALSFVFGLFPMIAMPQTCAPGNLPNAPSTPACAQPNGSNEALNDFYRETMWRHLEEDRQSADVVRRREANAREKEMIEKASKFAKLWRALFEELGTRGTFNIKTARELSKSFRDMERIGAWPKVDNH